MLRTERSGKLLDAEQATLEAGGTVVRLGGLYRLESGAHNFWAKGGSFPSKPAGLINLVIIYQVLVFNWRRFTILMLPVLFFFRSKILQRSKF